MARSRLRWQTENQRECSMSNVAAGGTILLPFTDTTWANPSCPASSGAFQGHRGPEQPNGFAGGLRAELAPLGRLLPGEASGAAGVPC